MRKLVIFLTSLVVFSLLFAGLWWVLSHTVSATQVEWSECKSTGPQCGTDNGTQYNEYYKYADPICPNNYSVQNSGNWNQRCHRNYHWMQPEHKAPLGCPEGYSQSGSNCRKLVKEERSCNTGDVQYDSCEQEGSCPESCGFEGGSVPDGKGGEKYCEATKACEEPKDYCDTLEGIQDEEDECPKPEEPKEEPKRKTFSEDKRCHDRTPPAITWINVEDGSASNGWFPKATWSAEGGSVIEVRFSEDPNDLRWTFKMLNDGQEVLGKKDNTGELGMVWYYSEWRTVNGCKAGPWSPVKWFN